MIRSAHQGVLALRDLGLHLLSQDLVARLRSFFGGLDERVLSRSGRPGVGPLQDSKAGQGRNSAGGRSGHRSHHVIRHASTDVIPVWYWSPHNRSQTSRGCEPQLVEPPTRDGDHCGGWRGTETGSAPPIS